MNHASERNGRGVAQLQPIFFPPKHEAAHIVSDVDGSGWEGGMLAPLVVWVVKTVEGMLTAGMLVCKSSPSNC